MNNDYNNEFNNQNGYNPLTNNMQGPQNNNLQQNMPQQNFQGFPPQDNQMQVNVEEKEKKKIPLIPIIIVGLLVIGVIVYFVFFRTKNNNNDSTSIIPSKVTTVTTDWKKMEFSIQGVKFQLPLTQEELLNKLPDGWEISEYIYKGSFTTGFLRYYGSDKTVKGRDIQLWINKKTNLIFNLAVFFGGSDNAVDINGLNYRSTKKDVEKVVGKLPNYDNLYNGISTNYMGYSFYVNGVDNKDGSLTIGPFNEEGYISSLSLFDYKDNPEITN